MITTNACAIHHWLSTSDLSAFDEYNTPSYSKFVALHFLLHKTIYLDSADGIQSYLAT